ncbi:hypothetical protein OIU74_017871 [Salix koriyanagi]|uniref:Uncharacterized protein n=1 Tax=Salix koriyanagi TaxID=2511006 RepID=A0A9Q0WQ74_9ROSI|nr:hypothetical protein OIU74_017871 [Salix koriyanagi]
MKQIWFASPNLESWGPDGLCDPQLKLLSSQLCNDPVYRPATQSMQSSRVSPLPMDYAAPLSAASRQSATTTYRSMPS